MSDRPRFVLPVLGMTFDPASGTLRASPTVEAAREKLGGRGNAGGEAEGEVGRLVRITGLANAPLGVVLFRGEGKVDVWLGGGRVRRVAESAVSEAGGPVPADLAAIAASVRVYASLREGQRVRYEGEGGVEEGLLLEKHRYGALIGRADEKVMAVGFGKVWPLGQGQG